MTDVDVKGLVDEGFLDLNEIFCKLDSWKDVKVIGTFSDYAHIKGRRQLVNFQVVVQSAERYGITTYRWVEKIENSENIFDESTDIEVSYELTEADATEWFSDQKENAEGEQS